MPCYVRSQLLLVEAVGDTVDIVAPEQARFLFYNGDTANLAIHVERKNQAMGHFDIGFRPAYSCSVGAPHCRILKVQGDHDRKPRVSQAAVRREGRRGRGRPAQGAKKQNKEFSGPEVFYVAPTLEYGGDSHVP